MNPPFYTGGPSMVDYTRIGALIGHEITHGFDSKGRNTDATGNYAGNAFSEAVREAFSHKEDCFRKQYFAYQIEELGEYVNGNKTLSENIADNGGIREAYRAYQKLLSRLPFKQRPDTDYSVDQLFFISYGTMWCKIDTMQSLTATFKSDIHAPSKFRVIGTLANMQEFADAFQCPVGTRMNPRDKCVLW
ncbi:Neprilysin 4 [Carabus blaptoides fortunei]